MDTRLVKLNKLYVFTIATVRNILRSTKTENERDKTTNTQFNMIKKREMVRIMRTCVTQCAALFYVSIYECNFSRLYAN